MLGSCRTELRRCIWDLRSDALDEPSFETAIHKSIEQVTGKAHVQIDVNAQRNKISDRTVHAILSIIRELVANAANHGRAQNIHIKGNLEGGKMNFSVEDDGCGFDPEQAPGLDEGHFGIAGVRERLRRHGGEMKIESSTGNGANVAFSIPLSSQMS